MALQNVVATVASVALRISSIIFFRLFPAHFPSITFALFAIHAPAFLASCFAKPELEVVDDRVQVAVKETKVSSETPLLTEDGVALEPEPETVTEEVAVKERIILAEKTTSPWRILLYGAPGAGRPILSAMTFLINVLLVGLTIDALYRSRWYHQAQDLSFVRLGYVDSTEAKFLIREPDQAKMPVTLDIRIKEPQPPFDNPLWQTAGGVRWTSNTTDFTATILVPLMLSEQRRYEWRTSNNHTGEFLSPPNPGSMPKYNDGKFTFISTSCILPRFPYNPLDHALAIPGLRHLATKLPDLGAQFMLFLGDFIYVDVPERFGKSAEEYRMQYRQVYASPDWAPVGQNLSWIHVLDDHEISNDWSSNSTGVYKAAVDPWHIYQADVNPPVALKAGSKNQRRTGATCNSKPFDELEKTMLGEEQLTDFLAWLARPEPKGNWPVNVKDTWGGFLVERKRILEAMWEAGARGTTVVILSGDRHEFAATKFPPPPESRWPETAAAFEFSTSPLNQFASPIPTYKQQDEEDIMLKYIPSGTSKFGTFTMEQIASGSTLEYRLFIDGQEQWRTELVEAPVVAGFSSGGSFWDKIGLFGS
ncbi:phoD-like phosphatase domain-containing protein [Hirsutella rhossiliensis]|uniref:PhoD-like phosphatase domain-containing protein n=1 Tax=Hirsutella rhossiliensis TaxID=111463 RepID=A0A9P8MZB4_9HYPO|nr:phoD-like phosphatase domain-containing protein [Hirsutella rhossiliensis]KAH0965213.1 phoD-like phosphatase domain-containing protein [Hirsutella rhossiliensis]